MTKLKARHYSILVLFAIVTLETSAIAVDRLFAKGQDAAFEVSGSFQNNAFIDQFKLAEAKAAPAPSRLTQLPALRRDAMAAAAAAAARNAAMTPPTITVSGPELVNRNTRENVVTAASALPALDRWVEYTVGRGDSLAVIAGQFNTTSDQIAGANGIADVRGLKAGQKLRIPSPEAKLMYAVREGDTLSRIASKFGIAIQDIIRSNNLKDHFLSEGRKIEIPVRVAGNKLEMVKEEVAAVTGPSMKNLEKIGTSPRLGGHQELALIKSSGMSIVPAAAISAAQAVTTNPPPSITVVAAPSKQAPVKTAPTVVTAPVMVSVATAMETTKVVRPVAAITPVTHESARTSVKATAPANVAHVMAAVSAPAPAAGEEMKMVSHVVKNGDSLATVARQYRTSISQILASNELSNSALKPGQQIKVPVNKRFFRVMQVTSRRADAGTRLVMPCRGRMNDLYGWRMHPVYHRKLFHAGVDITAPRGSAINAAMGGVVVFAGWMSGYGKLVVIRHPNGLSTRYGHCSSVRVSRGQSVRSGQLIGGVGSTGTATGNHLHFEVRRDGRPMNPTVALGWR
ncbi:MAG: LysM peptidoglycan-binding domain-containing protein [Candidatus Ozemobacteraceae bacterium]